MWWWNIISTELLRSFFLGSLLILPFRWREVPGGGWDDGEILSIVSKNLIQFKFYLDIFTCFWIGKNLGLYRCIEFCCVSVHPVFYFRRYSIECFSWMSSCCISVTICLSDWIFWIGNCEGFILDQYLSLSNRYICTTRSIVGFCDSKNSSSNSCCGVLGTDLKLWLIIEFWGLWPDGSLL